MGIRNDRYKAMCPTVTGALRLQAPRARARSAARARPYQAQAQIHPARPDDHRRHHRRRALRRPREDGDGVCRRCSTRKRAGSPPTASTSSSSTSRPSMSTWTRPPAGASRRCIAPSTAFAARPPCTSATATASRPISTGRRRSATSGGNTRRFFPALAKSRIDQVSVECINSHVPMSLLSLLDGKDVLVGVIDVATDKIETPEEVAAVIGEATKYVPEGKNRRLHQLRHGADAPRHRRMKLEALGQGAALAREKFGKSAALAHPQQLAQHAAVAQVEFARGGEQRRQRRPLMSLRNSAQACLCAPHSLGAIAAAEFSDIARPDRALYGISADQSMATTRCEPGIELERCLGQSTRPSAGRSGCAARPPSPRSS